MKKTLFFLLAVSMITHAFSQADTSITPGNYDYITPEGWLTQKNKDHILLQNPQSGCAIRLLDPQPSSGDIEQDCKAVFDIMYQGWQYRNTGERKYTLSKGYLTKGLEYCMMEAAMSKMSADQTRYDGFEDGAAMIVKAGSKIIILSIRHTDLMAHIDCDRNYNTWRRFFNSFTVKGVKVIKNESDAAQRIIGGWSMLENSASGEYVFAANGNYAFVGAIGSTYTTRDFNYDYLHIKTYSFKGDGKYTIASNKLKLQKRNRTPENIQFRFEKVNHGGAGWKDRIYMLQTLAVNGKENEVCYEKEK